MEPTLPKAPVNAHAEMDIAADPRAVWTIIADIASWPTWDPAVREASFDDEPEVGAAFRFSTVFGSMKCRLTHVDAPHRLAWKGRVLTLTERQAFVVRPLPTGAHVSLDATIGGLGAHLFKRRLNERLQGQLDALVRLLKLEAEARAIEERDDAERAAELAARAKAHE